jgi:UDP-glucose 4-epimerase
MADKTYLVTGGAGFIGSHLTTHLIARGDKVVILDNFSTGDKNNLTALSSENLEIISGDILDENLVNSLVERVDEVLHLAAAVGVFTIVDKPLRSLQTNLKGSEHVFASANRYQKPIFLASTSEVYGKNSNVPLNEESDRVLGSPLKSRWSYSEAKAIDESLAIFYHLESGLPVRLVRFFNTVGPRQVGHYGMVVPRFVQAALKNEPIQIYGDGSQSRAFCHVQDAIAGVVKVLASDAAIGNVFNIGNNEEVTIKALAEKIISITNSKSSIEFIPYENAYAPGFEDMQRRVPDISKAKQVLGWEPTISLTQIIEDIAAHFRSSDLK